MRSNSIAGANIKLERRPGGIYLYRFNPAWSCGNVVGSIRMALINAGLSKSLNFLEYGQNRSGKGEPP